MMQKIRKLIWKTDAGRTLLEDDGGDEVRVMPAMVDACEAVELAEALNDYIAGARAEPAAT